MSLPAEFPMPPWRPVPKTAGTTDTTDVAGRDHHREQLDQLRADRDALAARLARAEQVVEAAVAWREDFAALLHTTEDVTRRIMLERNLRAAVDSYQKGPADGLRAPSGDERREGEVGHDDPVYERLQEAVNGRLRIAEAATPGPWAAATTYPEMVAPPRMVERREVAEMTDAETWVISTTLTHHAAADAEHIAANDPARIIRDCQRDLRVLERHAPAHVLADGSRDCVTCPWIGWPCLEIKDLAEAYQIDGSTT